MKEELEKKYYKIKDVADFIGVTQSTLRFWEREFPQCAPKRNAHNIRYYTPANIKTLRIIHYLLKDRGLKIEAAKKQLSENIENISKKMEIIDTLTETRNQLQYLLKALEKRK